MSQICLYLDEDVSQNALIEALRNSDLDIITTAEVNRLSYPDEEQLTWATQQARVIYSFNMRDYCRIHSIFLAQGITHAGILLAPQQRVSIGQQLRAILKLVSTKSAAEMVNQLVFLRNYID